MTNVKGPTTPTFRPVNAMDLTPNEPGARSAALTGNAPTVSAFGFRSHVALETAPIKSEPNTSTTFTDVTNQSDGSQESLTGKDASDEGSKDSEKPASSGKGSGKVKKRKGTKFHCKGFGPCNLSFTRSEHLARHIRKHTGERPFMCHCGRWFSRLDNLRQHSSTVHADEEIPTDSLAATGTRYQRHGRPERSRPRSRGQSQSNIQPLPSQTPGDRQPATPVLGSPMEDRRRRRPEPILIPPVDRGDAVFKQYRSQTPPDSPSSAVSNAYRPSTSYASGSLVSSPLATPTSSRFGGPLDTPFDSPRSLLGALNFDTATYSMASRRLSMPMPPTPSLLNAAENRVLPVPSLATGFASAARQADSRRESISSISSDDRRRTWHMGTPASYQNPLPREIMSPTTQSFARTSITNEANCSPIAPARSQPADRLPSIHDVLTGFGTTPESQRSPWAGDILERVPSSEVGKTLHEGLSAVPARRVAPGQMRSSHGRSISNIETRRWGVPAHSNPFSGPWIDHERRQIPMESSSPAPPSTGSNRSSGYFAAGVSSPREHRHSFGSSGDSSVSDGIHTPAGSVLDASRPRILGEPGDAVFHTEVNILSIGSPLTTALTMTQSPGKDGHDNSYEMSGVESTGVALSMGDRGNRGQPQQVKAPPTGYNVSRLDALVSAAAIASKIA